MILWLMLVALLCIPLTAVDFSGLLLRIAVEIIGILGTVRYKVLPFFFYITILFGIPLLAVAAVIQTLLR